MSWVFPNVSRPRLLTGIGGVTMTAMGGLAYATAFMSPAAPVIGVAGLGVVVYACVYAKKQAVITWPPLATVTWRPGLRSAAYEQATLNHAECGLTYTLSSGAPGVDLDAGRYTIVASSVETPNYQPASAPSTFVIQKLKPPVQWSAAAINVTYPAALPVAALNAHVGGAPGQMRYSVRRGQTVSAVQGGVVLMPGEYTLVATYVPTGPNHEGNHAERPFTVQPGVLTLAWGGPVVIDYGDASILDATASVPGGAFTYKSGKLTLDGSTERLDARDAPYELSVEYRLAGYGPASATRRVTVRRIPIPIVWGPLAAIEHGQALGPVQLNATSPVRCRPATYRNTTTNRGVQSGTVLEGGAHVLEVTFITEIPNYISPGRRTVALQVNPATPVIDWTPPAEISDGRPVDPLYAGARARNPHSGAALAANQFINPNPPLGTRTVLGAGVLNISLDFAPTTPANHQGVPGITRQVQVVRVTAAELADAGITPAMRAKILTGEITEGVLIGAHSRSILTDAAFATRPRGPAHADQSRTYEVRKNLPPPDGGQTPTKLSTLPPPGWTDDDILRATVDTADTAVVERRPQDGATLHQFDVNGVNWSVVCDRDGGVIMSCPTGGGFTL